MRRQRYVFYIRTTPMIEHDHRKIERRHVLAELNAEKFHLTLMSAIRILPNPSFVNGEEKIFKNNVNSFAGFIRNCNRNILFKLVFTNYLPRASRMYHMRK